MISTLFYRNYRLLLLTVLLIILWGIVSFFTLPRLEDPVLTSRNAVVKTFLPGADAERMEALVTDRIEAKLTEIEEIETYESVSRAGSSIIQIELFDWVKGDQVDTIWPRVRDQLAEAAPELPPGTTTPELEEIDVKAYAMIASLVWAQDEPANYAILRRLSQSLEDRLLALPGTEDVDVFGDPDEEVTVTVDPAALTTLNLSADDLARQIQQSDAKLGAGQFRSATSDLPLEVESELASLEQIRTIPIQFGAAGQFTRLGDIAEVSKGIAVPASELSLVNGQPAIALAVFVAPTYRIDRWAQAAEQALAEVRQQLPSGLDLQVIFSQNGYVADRLNSLIVNLLLGAGLVFGVTFFMMGWQSALIVGLALPLSSFMVLGFMQLLGIPMHQMSITGLIVALGLLIDTAIVVVDEVGHRLTSGIAAETAIRRSVGYLAVPLLGSTVTTILAFIPIVRMPGGPGEFVGTIGVSVILAVSSSLFLSLTVIPALSARLHQFHQSSHQSRTQLPPGPGILSPAPTHPWWQTGVSHPYLTKLYRASLRRLFARPVLAIILTFSLPVVGFVQVTSLTEQFFPPTDRDQLQIEIELPVSASLAQTQAIAQQVRATILSHPEVTDVRWFLGRSAPRYYYNLVGGRENYANYAQGLIQLQGISNHALINTIQTELDQAFPVSRNLVRQLEQGPPFDAPVEWRVYGPDLEQLRWIGEHARGLLAQIPQVTHTRDSLSEVRPQLKFQVDEDQARLVGLDNASVSQQLNATLDGHLGGSILEDTEEIPVRVRVSDRDRSDLNQIISLDLLPTAPSLDKTATRSVNTIPLSALGTVELTPEPSVITHRNGRRFNVIQAYLAAGVLPAEVLTKFQDHLATSGFALPAGYWAEIGGESEERDSALAGLFSSVGVVAVLTVATLVLSLSSFRLAGLILGVAVGSIGLGFFALWLFGYPFGFMGIVGTFGLVGIAVNDSVVVLAALRDHPQARIGNRRAVRDVVVHATRHVIATTLTTMIGFVPLVLEGGGFWPPLAIAIAGGIGGATLLALVFIPSAYVLLAAGDR